MLIKNLQSMDLNEQENLSLHIGVAGYSFSFIVKMKNTYDGGE